MTGSADGTEVGRAGRPALAELLALAAVLAVALWLRLGDFDQPFTGRGWQHMSARLAIMGRNFVEQGYLATHFAPPADAVPPPDGHWTVYLNHPPLLALLVSVTFRIFGVHEWSARLLMVACSLGALLAMWALARRLFGRAAGLVAAALGATAPITAFYGSLLCENGSLLLLLLALAMLLALRQEQRPTRGGWRALLLVLGLAAATDWQGHLFIGALLCHQLWLGRRARAASLAGVLLLMLAVHGALLLGARSSAAPPPAAPAAATAATAPAPAGPADRDDLLGIFWMRSWGGVAALGGPARVLRALWHHLASLYTLTVLLLAGLGLLQLRRARSPSLLLVMLLFGVADVLIFVEGAARHEFWNVTLAPALFALAGAGAAAVVASLRPALLRQASLAALAVAAAAPGVLATRERFADIRDDYFHTLGTVIEQHSAPGDLVGTCEFWTDPLGWYSHRKVNGDLTDRWIPPGGLPPSLAPAALFVIPERLFGPHEHARLLELLGARYPCEIVDTEACGPIHLFDLRRRLP